MRLLILFISIIWVGCQPITSKVNTADAYFDLPGFSKELLKFQVDANSRVIKTTEVNNVEEKRNIDNADSAFWVTELFPLLNGNINNPSLTDAYAIEEEITEESSNLKKTVYTALPESNTTIKKLEIKYLTSPNEVRQIFVLFDNKNSVYNTQQAIQLWINKYNNKLLIDSLITQGFNKTILLDSMKYRSKVIVFH